MKRISQNKIIFFQENIIKWYDENGRDFPWRKKNLTSYQLVIAEILLQRTKAETISKFYPLFLKKYPSWKSLNKTRLATLEKVLTPIGLYKQRAALIKKLAKEMIKSEGNFPRQKEEIEKLPFAGQYITNAILQFVFNKPAPLLDVNMARVLERFFGPRKLSDIRYDPYLQKLARKIVDHKNSKKINWGVLDFSALTCRSQNPKCEICFLSYKCIY
jgi:A/G-specific adenine glycosylase